MSAAHRDFRVYGGAVVLSYYGSTTSDYFSPLALR